MTTAPAVTIVCALPSEAAPLVEAFRLRCVRERPFRLHAGSDGVRLVVSGMGGHAAATAVGFAAGIAPPAARDVWLNVGIAGHRELPLGTAVLAHKVALAATSQAWYPTLLFDAPCPSASVTTFAHPVSDYPADTCCDMEAAGFMAAATAVAGGDLVHVVKVVSDNAAHGLEALDRAAIRRLIAGRTSLVRGLIERLREVACALPATADEAEPDAVPATLQGRWRFTAAECAQLRELRRRHAALTGGAPWPGIDLGDCRGAGDALARLRAAVDALPLPLPRQS
jgi:hypothetical protein